MFGLRKLFTFVASLLFFVGASAPPPSAAHIGCIAGTYLVKEGSGTQGVWTLSADGTLQITSSAEVAFNFSHIQGAWRPDSRRRAKAVAIDFNFIPVPVGNGALPAAIARIDIAMSFSRECNEMEGELELRFFDPETEDPLEPATGTGAPTIINFMGRRIRVNVEDGALDSQQ
jgi:hypothetical protein